MFIHVKFPVKLPWFPCGFHTWPSMGFPHGTAENPRSSPGDPHRHPRSRTRSRRPPRSPRWLRRRPGKNPKPMGQPTKTGGFGAFHPDKMGKNGKFAGVLDDFRDVPPLFKTIF